MLKKVTGANERKTFYNTALNWSYHCDVGGGAKTDTQESQRRIDTGSLAWMCDQIDGLVSFSPEAADLMLPPVNPDAVWQLDSEKAGELPQGASDRKVDPEEEFSTRERMHTSIQLRIEMGKRGYDPKTLDAKGGTEGDNTPK
ncbi:uncharacterized protein L3040_008367 [Drepanopeziza brunnea f. sp. 'multigermtubi']|uniref:uncharacterized protein n=1 Tax=Drepanopeziza brunnea f. sp. 'multigermtubi' TaxID=698441 RepID=UPI0023A108CD|nr:hypothetical protein L3040_008367 [Drepanopeziza brunnea f. sp. 'multigermtubi']